MALSDGLQGWWCPSLDTSGNGTTTLTDLSGNGNNGTLTNMDAATDWVADTDSGGVRALEFDPAVDNQYVTTADIDSPDVITVGVWIKPYSSYSYDGIIAKRYGSVTAWAMDLSASASRFYVANPSYTIINFTLPVISDWNLLCASFEKTGVSTVVKCYLNGVLVGSNGFGNSMILNDYPVTIGDTRGTHPTDKCFDGLIDGVFIYNRVLTADEISQIYNGGRSFNLLASEKASNTFSSSTSGIQSVSASGTLTTFAAWKAFDGSLGDSDCWISNNSSPFWIKIDFGESVAIGESRIAMRRNDSREPRDFEIQVSNNDADWTTVHSEAGYTWPNTQLQSILHDSSASGRYWRILITATAGSSSTAIGEWQLWTPANTTQSIVPQLLMRRRRLSGGLV